MSYCSKSDIEPIDKIQHNSQSPFHAMLGKG